ncbi:hypothetical protein SAMN04487771_104210 [[Clostridium] aminophilum]|uniref:Uncharacterized protein n=1 Tax=[Clostridium] aminophilum TaxID=1526 RepID=A0A1I0H3X2_9FIRM|nr:hypothetical protein [[Clostridium] aminophilum]SET77491.1 hypothetical protein SAMN04487771_104210 [[Clostridium] aminophilum]
MTGEELQTSIRNIMYGVNDYGIEIFTFLREEEELKIKKLRSTDKLLVGTKNRLAETVNNLYLSEDAEFEMSENIADNKKAIYEIELTDDYNPFSFLEGAMECQEYYSERDRRYLAGLFF